MAPHYRSVASQLVTAVLWLSDALLITTLSFVTRGQLWWFLLSGSLWTIFYIYAVSTLCLYAIWWLANEIFVNSFTIFRMVLRDCAFVHSVCKTRWISCRREAATICPRPCDLDLWASVLESGVESRVTWATFVPILVFLGLSVLDLGPMYATDVRPTDSIA